MNTEKLTRIKAALQRVVELGEKLPQGEWLTGERFLYALTESRTGVMRYDWDQGTRRMINAFSIRIEHDNRGDHTTTAEQVDAITPFIAFSRNLSPWMAKALLATIERLFELEAYHTLSALIDSAPDDL